MTKPIDVIIHCPRCGEIHIDEPNPETGWTNPPHKSHLCLSCSVIWRVADVPTNGVAATQTQGKNDNWFPPMALAVGVNSELCEDEGCPHHGVDHVCINTSHKDVINPEDDDRRYATFFTPPAHEAVQQSDEMFCHKCGRRWGVDEDAPECV